MWDWQLEKIDRIFKREKFEIHHTELDLTQHMNKSWQQVGGADSTMGDFMAPYDEFLNNIEEYKFNKLLDIGRISHVYRHLLNHFFSVSFLHLMNPT